MLIKFTHILIITTYLFAGSYTFGYSNLAISSQVGLKNKGKLPYKSHQLSAAPNIYINTQPTVKVDIHVKTSETPDIKHSVSIVILHVNTKTSFAITFLKNYNKAPPQV